MITQHIKIVGRVQGVGYRRWVADMADSLHLSGWVRNVSDGSVEIMVKGANETVFAFMAACRKGSAFSHILSIQPVILPTAAPAPIEEGKFKIVASV